MMEHSGSSPPYDPAFMERVSSLRLVARGVVEGLYTGVHKSPYHGFSVEFSDYREYVPGDDPRAIDWKAYARTDRYFIKRFEAETNLRGYLVVDASASMGFSSGNGSRFAFAARLASCFAYLLLSQGDMVGLATFGAGLLRYIPPRASLRHFGLVTEELARTEPSGETDPTAAFRDLAGRIRRRGLVLVFSDLFHDTDALLTALRHFRHRKHEVAVFHLLDPQEMTLEGVEGMVMFEDMEGGGRVLVDVERLRDAYRRRVERYVKSLRRSLGDMGAEYVYVDVSRRVEDVFVEYLSARNA